MRRNLWAYLKREIKKSKFNITNQLTFKMHHYKDDIVITYLYHICFYI